MIPRILLWLSIAFTTQAAGNASTASTGSTNKTSFSVDSVLSLLPKGQYSFANYSVNSTILTATCLIEIAEVVQPLAPPDPSLGPWGAVIDILTNGSVTLRAPQQMFRNTSYSCSTVKGVLQADFQSAFSGRFYDYDDSGYWVMLNLTSPVNRQCQGVAVNGFASIETIIGCTATAKERRESRIRRMNEPRPAPAQRAEVV